MSAHLTTRITSPLEAQFDALLQESAVDLTTMESLLNDLEDVLVHAGVLHSC